MTTASIRRTAFRSVAGSAPGLDLQGSRIVGLLRLHALHFDAGPADRAACLPLPRARLGGCHCDLFDDDRGRAWGDENQPIRVVAELARFVYEELDDGPGDLDPGRGPCEPFVERRLRWIAQHQTAFDPRPYEHLAKVMQRRGEEESARALMLGKLKRQRREMRAARPALAALLYGAVELPFQFGLFWRNAFVTFLLFWLLGAWYFDTANQGRLRLLPTGEDGFGWDTGRVPALLVDSRAVATVAVPDARGTAPGLLIARRPGDALTGMRCGGQVEPIVYALDAMVPLLDLHQEERCTMSGSPEAFGWRVGAAAYSVLGAYVTAMLLLTVSGVLRRNVER